MFESTILFTFVVLVIPLISLTQQELFELDIQRSFLSDVITLWCRNVSTLSDINLQTNPGVKFYLNFTEGDRCGSGDLEERISPGMLIRSGVQATFLITPELNGFYSCGTGPGQQSSTLPLISIVTTNRPDNLQTDYTIEKGAESVTLQCPYEPGNLLNCYFGEWKKGGSTLVRVPPPHNINYCDPVTIENKNSSRYRLDKKDFSLTIVSPQESTDNGEYTCQLRFQDPLPYYAPIYSYPLGRLNLTVINRNDGTTTFEVTGVKEQELRVAVIILAITCTLLVVALTVMSVLLTKSRLNKRSSRNDTDTHQIPFHSQSIPTLPERNKRHDSAARSAVLGSNSVSGRQQNLTEFTEHSNVVCSNDVNEQIANVGDYELSSDDHNYELSGSQSTTYEDNLAYGTNVATAPNIATGENVAYALL